MTNEEAEELAILRRLIKRELATTQRFHAAMRAIATALAINNAELIRPILGELGYTAPALGEGQDMTPTGNANPRISQATLQKVRELTSAHHVLRKIDEHFAGKWEESDSAQPAPTKEVNDGNHRDS